MARPVYRYQPRNESPDIAIGIPLPFNMASKARPVTAEYTSNNTSGNSVFGSTYTTEEQSISNLKNLILTRKGERIMQPNFGTNVYDLLFENNVQDVRSIIKKTITKDVNYWLPYITINDIKIETDIDMNQLTVAIHFKITNIGSNLVINVTATENSLQVSDVVTDTSLQQINITTAGGY